MSKRDCERCKDWANMGLSDTCPTCDAIQNEIWYGELREERRKIAEKLSTLSPKVDSGRCRYSDVEQVRRLTKRYEEIDQILGD